MLRYAHKALLIELAREHENELRHNLRLARAHFGPSHRTVKELTERVEFAHEAVQTLEVEPVRAVA